MALLLWQSARGLRALSLRAREEIRHREPGRAEHVTRRAASVAVEQHLTIVASIHTQRRAPILVGGAVHAT